MQHVNYSYFKMLRIHECILQMEKIYNSSFYSHFTTYWTSAVWSRSIEKQRIVRCIVW